MDTVVVTTCSANQCFLVQSIPIGSCICARINYSAVFIVYQELEADLFVCKLVIPSPHNWMDAGTCRSKCISGLGKVTWVQHKRSLIIHFKIIYHYLEGRETDPVMNESSCCT